MTVSVPVSAPVPVRAISPPRMLPLGTSQPPGDKYVCLNSIIFLQCTYYPY
jgi:hypothetical protein